MSSGVGVGCVIEDDWDGVVGTSEISTTVGVWDAVPGVGELVVRLGVGRVVT